MKNKVNLISSPNNIVPLNVQLVNDITVLSQDITEGQSELQRILDNLDSSAVEVNIKRNWWGTINRESIEEIVKNVYSNLGSYIGKLGEAIQQTNDNLVRTLELIKLLARVEKDLYEKLDDQIVDSNEIKTILIDWFKKQGIKDEDIQELLETSFQRAYTLRDRLNSLRQEYRENIAQCKKRIDVFEEKHTSLDNKIAELIKKTESELQNAFDNNKQTFEKLYNEKSLALETLANGKEKNLNALADKSAKDYKAIEEILSKIEALAKEKCNELSKIKNDAEENINTFITNKKAEIELLKNEFQNQIKEQANKFEEEKKVLISSLNKRLIWIWISSIAASSIIAYIITILSL